MESPSASPRTFTMVFVGLIVLTLATVALSFFQLGPWHLLVGSAIGVLKATLVALFFMHLFWGPGRTWLAAGLGLFWLGILVALTMSDYLTRHLATF